MNVGSMGKKTQKISPNARKKNNDIKKSENGLILRVVAKMARSLVIPPLLCRSLLAEVIAGSNAGPPSEEEEGLLQYVQGC